MKEPIREKGLTKARISCCGVQHEIFFHTSGAVLFKNHPNISPKALAMEWALQGEGSTFGCFEVAAALVGGINGVTDTSQVPAWLWRSLEALEIKRKSRKAIKESDYPLDTVPLQLRRLHIEHPLCKDAIFFLNQAKFRTSAVGHRVAVLPSLRTAVASSYEPLPKRTQIGKTTFANKRQCVELELNLAEWARVHRRGVGLVQEFFVTKVVKEWSKNELHVVLLKQSTGYKVVLKDAIVRKGSDTVWRVHEWL